MRENCPFAATLADALPAGPPSASSPARRGVAGQSAAIRTTTTSMKEPCNACGCGDWQQARFIAGRLLCETCWAGRIPAASMVPNAHEQIALAEWLAPQPRRAP